MVELSHLCFKQLRDYLLDHEQDIACSINDFDDLRQMFVEVIGRAPENPMHSEQMKKLIRKKKELGLG